ncbi:MAG TPA: type II CAAX endopeptidase family protein [Chthoniobacteraceae bacterium]|jgi:hypothetical protein
METQILTFLVSLALACSAVTYSRLLQQVHAGGKVRTAEFAFPDLLVSISLIFSFGGLIALSLLGEKKQDAAPIDMDQLVGNALVFVVLIAAIAGFLRYRGIRLSSLVGVAHISAARSAMLALGLIVAALPIVFLVGWLTQQLMREAAQEQELVTLFRDVAKSADQAAVLKILLAGVIIAPLWEEFLFRGYFYGVFKRYIGGTSSAVLTAALFAAFHANLTSLPSLFVLALCFTIAYEASGSLLVPIGMHALFNFSQLGFLYYQATAPLP